MHAVPGAGDAGRTRVRARGGGAQASSAPRPHQRYTTLQPRTARQCMPICSRGRRPTLSHSLGLNGNPVQDASGALSLWPNPAAHPEGVPGPITIARTLATRPAQDSSPSRARTAAD